VCVKGDYGVKHREREVSNMFTKEQQQKIADVIREIPDYLTRRRIAADFCDMLAVDNDRFNYQKFFAACNAD